MYVIQALTIMLECLVISILDAVSTIFMMAADNENLFDYMDVIASY